MDTSIKNTHIRRTWDEWYVLAEQYRAEQGDLLVPREYRTAEGALLGRWIERMRAIYNNKRRGRLYKDQIDELERIGMIWKLENRFSWEEWMSLCREYRNRNGNLNVPRDWAKGDMKLGEWLNNQRMVHLRGELNVQQIQDLNRVGMEWEVSPYRPWGEWYADAKAYYERHGNLQIPKDGLTEDGFPIGRWLSTQRELYKGKAGHRAMPEERIRLLEAIGMEWYRLKQRQSDER